MKNNLAGLAAVVCLGLTAALAAAQPPPGRCMPQAPDACGPGFYYANPCGAIYGPNYWLRPPFPPFNGMPPGFGGGSQGCGGPQGCGPNQGGANPGGIAAFPTHPYARGPRDFFMLN